jgi:hypothetical protein
MGVTTAQGILHFLGTLAEQGHVLLPEVAGDLPVC